MKHCKVCLVLSAYVLLLMAIIMDSQAKTFLFRLLPVYASLGVTLMFGHCIRALSIVNRRFIFQALGQSGLL